MFVQQTMWQRNLLRRYGNEIALIDATYRTSMCAMPLFLIVVPTNSTFVPVASFVIENENWESISEALQVIKEWNPWWHPKEFMSDFCEAELKALNENFKGTTAFINL